MPRTATAKVTKASSNPVIKSGALDSTEFQVGNDKERVMQSVGPAEASLSPADRSQQHDRLMGGAVDLSYLKPEMTRAQKLAYKRAHDAEYQANLKFFDEPVEIYIHTTTNKQDAQRFPVQTNNADVVFERGKTYTVKRAVVNILAHAKKTTYTQKEGIAPDGSKVMRQVPETALEFPFNVTRDDNPLGKKWLEFTLAQP